MNSDLEKIISPIYMVGGSVRDEIMGVTPKDYDFATPISPDQIEEKIRGAGLKPYLIGKKFGTIGVKLNRQFVEITTFRSEKYISGSRKPNVVFVGSISEDLSRRDFTINAIAKRKNRLIDPFGGSDDIKNKIIRTVGSPKERFKEDPLRMLRAARFAAQLNFKIEDYTLKKIEELSYKILEVSKERWMEELDKILLCDKPSLGLNVIMKTRLMNFMIPELSVQLNYNQNSPYHKLNLWDHTAKTVDLTPSDLNLRWAALFHDIGKPFVRKDKKDRSNYVHHEILGREIAIKNGRYLKWSNERIKMVSDIVGGHLDNSPIHEADNAAKE